MVLAKPEDLQVENEIHLERSFVQVVCGARSIAEVPEQLTVGTEVVLNVVSFIAVTAVLNIWRGWRRGGS